MIVQVPALTPRTMPPPIVHTGSVVLVNVIGVSPWSDVAARLPVPPAVMLGAAAKASV